MKVRLISDTPAVNGQPEAASAHWYEVLRRMADDGYRYRSVEVVEDGAADYVVVINHPYLSGRYPYPTEATILVLLEPTCVHRNKWGPWTDPTTWGNLAGVVAPQMDGSAIEWHISTGIGELRSMDPPEKALGCSCCITWKDYYEGHQWRQKLVKEHLATDERIDFWGQMVKPGSADGPGVDRWMGTLPMRRKDAALYPYRYHLAMENSVERGYWTEKIADALLAWCLPLYRGCPNITDYLPDGCMIRLPEDHAEAAEKVREVISGDAEYRRRLPYIEEARKEILNRWSVFARVEESVSPF